MQKVSKTVKKSSEKVLTGSRNCDIITELSARAAKASGTAMILENDTERNHCTRKQSDSERVKRSLRAGEGIGFGELILELV